MEENKELWYISWIYSGAFNGYRVYLNGEKVFSTRSAYQRDMFIAELKVKIDLMFKQGVNEELIKKAYFHAYKKPLPLWRIFFCSKEKNLEWFRKQVKEIIGKEILNEKT